MKIKILCTSKLIFAIVVMFSLCGFSFSKNYKPITAKVSGKISIPKWYHEGICFDDGKIWVNNGEKGKTWVFDAASGLKIKEIEPAGTFTEAITPKGEGLFFVTDWDAKKIYIVHIDNGRMVAQSEVSVAPANPAGAAWNGTNLFVVTWMRSPTGTKFHLLKMDEKCNLLSRVMIKKIAEPDQLAWDGKNLWVSCWFSKRVYKVDVDEYEILGYFRSPVPKTTGIAWDGKNLWVTGTNADLYKMEVQD